MRTTGARCGSGVKIPAVTTKPSICVLSTPLSQWHQPGTLPQRLSRWQGGYLTVADVELNVTGQQPDDVSVRFDDRGELSFMQRQLAGRREAVSADSVELYRFDAQRMLAQTSDALREGRVVLRQGRWQGGTQVRGCEGQQVNVAFDRDTLATLYRQQQGQQQPITLSWLEAPEGIQLLRATPEDECRWQPKEPDF